MNLKELCKDRKEKTLNSFFGENNYESTNNRFACKNHILNDDEIIIATANISYFKNKNQFVMWVANDKIVYLKDFQVIPVFNYELIGECWLVKLNRKFFKSYNCFKNEDLHFEKEDTFEDLVNVAKQQNEKKLYFKPSTDKFGNKAVL